MATAFTLANMDTSKFDIKNSDPTKKPGRGMLHVRSRVINFDTLATATGTALAHSDTYQVFDLAPGDIIIAAGVNILTAATAAATLDLGFTGGTVDYFVDGLAANDTTLPSQTDGYFNGPAYISAADTLDLKEAGGAQTLAGCVAQVWALIARIDGS